MLIFNGINSYVNQDKPVVLAMGMFDGIHLGHKKVLEEAKKIAADINGLVFVLTFDIHPKRLLYPDNEFYMLTTNDEKIMLFKKLNIDGVVFLYFDNHTANMDPENFLRNDLLKKINAKAIVVGDDFKFGKDKKGDVKFLKKFCNKLDVKFKVVDAFKDDNGDKVSSSLIREYIKNSSIKDANIDLGHNYFIHNKVIKGLGLASKFGIPTANIHIPHFKILPKGVFTGYTNICGKEYPSVISVGSQKTLEKGEDKLCLETHVLNFDEDIYHKDVSVKFVDKLRDQKKFDSLDDLFDQIKKDVDTAKVIFSKL